MPIQAELAELSPADIEALYGLDSPSDLEADPGFEANLRSLAVFVLCQARLDSERDCRAASWLASDGDTPGGFVWWCAVLDLDPEVVRPLLLGLSREEIIRVTNGGTG